MIDSAVKTIIMSKRETPEGADESERWKTRVAAYALWKTKSVLSSVKAGDKIDVRDTEHIWCAGTIELKISTSSRHPLLYIHYEVSVLSAITVGMEQEVR